MKFQNNSPADGRAGHSPFSRRGFLVSFAALGLTACGGGGGSASASGAGSTSTASAASVATAGSTATQGFAHPGLLHTAGDFTRMAQKVAASASPWVDGWNVLVANSHAQLSYTPRPQAVVYRGYDGTHGENYSLLYNDIAAAYACALRWKVTGNTAYADKAVEIMNAWSSTLTGLGGTTDVDLAAGIYGYEFANAAEIMRDYAGWAAADFARFQTMMTGVFYPISHDFLNRHNGTEYTHYWSNWDLCNIAAIMAIGVLCDTRAYFDEAVTYFKSGGGNGCILQAVYYLHPGYLGQMQESGRDQGHNTLSIALAAAICEMAWNQGIDLYGYDNNRFLAGAEYVAKGNLIESGTTYYTVPFVYYTNIDKVAQTAFSTASQGNIRPCWALIYNHYVRRKGLAAPYTAKFMQLVAPEGGGGNYGPNSGGYDQLGYGTLTATRDAEVTDVAPSGLTARYMAETVVLSWWGSASAASYTVKRAAASGGPYTTVASGITDLLTWADTSLTGGVYYYVVTAILPSGESAPSAEARVVAQTALHTQLSFDEGTGATAADATGNGHSATLTGAAWGSGKRGSALALGGSGAYAALPSDSLLDLADFTVAAWVYWNGGQTWARVFDFGSGTGRYMMLTPRTSGGIARFAITLNGYSGEEVIDAASALPSGRWVHVAVTLSGATGRLYIDGVEAGSNSAMNFAPFRIGPTTQNWLGRSQFSADPYLNGRIDDFRIYSGALGAADIAALAQA